MVEALNPRTKRVREALIQAAREAVAEHSVNEISLTQIAESAQVSRPTIYKQFNDTASLVAEATIQLMEEVFADIDEELSDDEHESVEYLGRLMGLFIQRVYQERRFCRNAMHGSSAASISMYVVNMLDERMARGLVGKRLAPSGRFAADYRRVLSAGVVWLLVEWLDSDFKDDNAPECFSRRLTSVLVEFSMAGSH